MGFSTIFSCLKHQHQPQAGSVVLLVVVLCLSSSLQLSHGAHKNHHHHSHHKRTHHTEVKVSSILPQDTCQISSQGKRDGTSLRVVHRHGPCSKLTNIHTDDTTTTIKTTPPSHEEILKHDQYRVNSIHIQCATGGGNYGGRKHPPPHRPIHHHDDGFSANLPAKSGSSLGSANYVVTVGLGTPKKPLSLVFDTGSDLTWTQCKPCLKSCYEQLEPIFEPASSATYTNISCTSDVCSHLVAGTGVKPGCTTSSHTCIYGIQYGDSSFSVGLLASDKLTLTESEGIDGFVFGCGEDNQGLFGGSAGLLGLGRNQLSLVSQGAGKYGNYFSYCLPLGSRDTGHLTLGKGGTKARKFTYTSLLSTKKNPSFYFIPLQAISVGGQIIPIPPSVFTTSGTIIDSGTVITRLAPGAYTSLRDAFRSVMKSSGYPMAPALSILDTCYDLSNYDTVSIPKVALLFGGGAVMDIPVTGIIFAAKLSQVCLAFAGNSGGNDPSIIGNIQQQGFDIVYDVDGGKLGFGADGC